MMRTQNTHDPSSRLNAVAPFVSAYPRSEVAAIWGDVGVALAIWDVMPTKDNKLVRKNNRLVVIVSLCSWMAIAVCKCSFRCVYKNIVTANAPEIKQFRKTIAAIEQRCPTAGEPERAISAAFPREDEPGVKRGRHVVDCRWAAGYGGWLIING